MTPCDLSQLQTEYNNKKWPTFLALENDKHSANLTLSVSDTLFWFYGHFPQQAILPGVAQTHWAALLSIKLFFIEHPLSNINNLKFKHIIVPNTEINLSLKKKADHDQVSFNYYHEERVFSSGILKYKAIS